MHFSLIWTKYLAEEILSSTFIVRRGKKTVCPFLAQQVWGRSLYSHSIGTDNCACSQHGHWVAGEATCFSQQSHFSTLPHYGKLQIVTDEIAVTFYLREASVSCWEISDTPLQNASSQQVEKREMDVNLLVSELHVRKL